MLLHNSIITLFSLKREPQLCINDVYVSAQENYTIKNHASQSHMQVFEGQEVAACVRVLLALARAAPPEGEFGLGEG